MLCATMAAPRVKSGDVLDGKYRVERVLGAGGMGMVVAARHIQLGQRVALKFMLREAMTEPAHAERFAREARAAVRLQSVHTAKVLDVGKLKNGEPYMVMEYLDGQDLDQVLQQARQVRSRDAVDYMLQACEAFAEAHGLGMIHRDIKLKNLFLTKTVDGRPLVKVLDFGLAKTVGGIGDVSLTATSAVFGSPQYMSPEQMRSAKDVDARSDIWSIGVCLYELVTGRVPFDAPGLAEICAAVLKDPLTPPSTYAPDLPADLEAAIVKCLAKDPKDRFQTVAELAFALEPWAAQEGSARRILHVMQSAQKIEVPTLVTVDPAALGTAKTLDEEPKTVDAWDSGDKSRKQPRIPPAVMVAAIGVAAIVGLAGVTLTVASLRGSGSKAAASVEPLDTAAAATAPATPVPVDTATSTAVAASPAATTAATAATATATAAATVTATAAGPANAAPAAPPSPRPTSKPIVAAPPPVAPAKPTTTTKPPAPPPKKPGSLDRL